MDALLPTSVIRLGLVCSLLLVTSVNATEPGQRGDIPFPSRAKISRLLDSLDMQIAKIDQVIASMEQQVEAQYQKINTTQDYTTRTRLEALAMRLGEKLLQLQELREQLVFQRSQTKELMNGLPGNK